MEGPEKAEPAARPYFRWLLLVAYVPLCFVVIGVLAFVTRLEVPKMGGLAFKDVFWSYAIPRPGTPSGLHIPSRAWLSASSCSSY